MNCASQEINILAWASDQKFETKKEDQERLF